MREKLKNKQRGKEKEKKKKKKTMGWSCRYVSGTKIKLNRLALIHL